MRSPRDSAPRNVIGASSNRRGIMTSAGLSGGKLSARRGREKMGPSDVFAILPLIALGLWARIEGAQKREGER